MLGCRSGMVSPAPIAGRARVRCARDRLARYRARSCVCVVLVLVCPLRVWCCALVRARAFLRVRYTIAARGRLSSGKSGKRTAPRAGSCALRAAGAHGGASTSARASSAQHTRPRARPLVCPRALRARVRSCAARERDRGRRSSGAPNVAHAHAHEPAQREREQRAPHETSPPRVCGSGL